MAVKEMNERLDGVYPTSQEEIEKINQRVKTIQSKAHYFRKYCTDPKVIPKTWPCYPILSLYLLKMQMSVEFIKANPDFLGHEWPLILEWGMEPKFEN